ncbi:MAG: RsmB/NOP family class I SAM-dependent RNA methyltransferase [Dongiaceae bacterium]
MIPGARCQTVLDILSEAAQSKAPLDRITTHHFRQRRYIGSHDRQAISQMVYGVIRHRRRLEYCLAQSGAEESIRRMFLLYLKLYSPWQEKEIAGAFNGDKFCPDPLSNEEKALLTQTVIPAFSSVIPAKAGIHHSSDSASAQWIPASAGMTSGDMPEDVAAECPPDFYRPLKSLFGDRFLDELKALNEEAGVDLRVNTLKAKPEEMLAELKEAGLPIQKMPYSPIGLRLPTRLPLDRIPGLKDGKLEIQDESSQIAAILLDVKSGQRVLDLCAGAGGKSLALASLMNGRGRIVATDVDAKRLANAKARIKRSGAQNIELRQIEGLEDKWLKRQEKTFDRVLVDAPCSGSGTWRRNPDARFRYKQADIERLQQTQITLLQAALPLLKKGGYLIYATCSLLREENEEVVAAALKDQPSYQQLKIAEFWPDFFAAPYPGNQDSAALRLTPAQHGVDGFVMSLMEKI